MHPTIPEVTGGCCYQWEKAAEDDSKRRGKSAMLAEREMPVSQYISLQDKLSKQHISLKKKKVTSLWTTTINHQSQLRESRQLAHIDEMSPDTQRVLCVK